MNEWHSNGYVRIHDQLSETALRELQRDAETLKASAVNRGISGTEIRRDGSFASRSRYRVHRGGPRLQSMLKDLEFLQLVREKTSLPRLIPVRCAYNYYQPGDYIGIHRDEVRATVTATFAVTDGLTPTRYRPDTRTASSEALVTVVDEEGYLPENGTDMPLPLGLVNLFDGYNFAHWRPRCDEPGILANLVYFEL
ncbi:hypothetical protein [Nocardia gipuzkoensis]